jgi:sugar/nucleoside kinase (ribokinase family)
MVAHPALAKADIRLAPASPGKARRLQPFLAHPNTTMYVNRGEAESLLDTRFKSSREAAKALADTGLKQAVVTDSAKSASASLSGRTVSKMPPPVTVKRYTGAGDVFMAAHISAELGGKVGASALEHALNACAEYISTDEAL